jgi:hypothetical protein
MGPTKDEKSLPRQFLVERLNNKRNVQGKTKRTTVPDTGLVAN